MWPFHRHRWRVREVAHGVVKRGTNFPVGSVVSQVVEHCVTCNRVRQKLLPGTWSLDELRTADSP